MRRTWWGPALNDDGRAVLDLVDDLVDDRLRRADDHDPEGIAAARRVLAGHGLWTLGADEAGGGGGADRRTTLLALARLAGTWPALAWASVQAHAACLLLSDHAADAVDAPALLADVHRGEPVAVVDATDEQVDVVGGQVFGVLGRVDAAAAEPRVLALTDRETAVLLPSGAVQHGPVLGRTGLHGAMTHFCSVQRTLPDGAVVRGPVVVRARILLHAGASALAAGVAEAAAHAAVSYSGEREQFGGPLTDLPTVRSSLSAQVTAVRRLLVTALAADVDDPVATAAALAPAMEDALDVAAAAVQSHGGYGYMVEYRVEGLLRDLVSLRAASGATDAARCAADVLVGADT
ncbi:MAG: acyl-CoA dehydrogenase family protein [Nocardioidaceae bacterium]